MSSQRFTVLCIDGDGFGLRIRRMVLESLGCDVEAFTSGPEALAAVAKSHFDIVLMDVVVEGMECEELARRIKRVRPSSKLLLLSSLVYPPQKLLPYIDQFATKGDRPQELFQLIAKTVETGRSRRHPVPQTWWSNLASSGARLWSRAFDHHDRHHDRALGGDSLLEAGGPQTKSHVAGSETSIPL